MFVNDRRRMTFKLDSFKWDVEDNFEMFNYPRWFYLWIDA